MGTLVQIAACCSSIAPHRRTSPLLLSQPSSLLQQRSLLPRSSSSLIFPSSPSPSLSRRGFAVRCNLQNGEVSPSANTPELGQHGGDATRSVLVSLLELLSTAFPAWVALACVAAVCKPHAFAWVNGAWQIFGLSVTMLGMGLTLSFKDFGLALAMPKELLAGVMLQYMVMPTAGALISRVLQLSPFYAAGLVLVACCPGGTASNIVTYLARGNVALSVMMTTASTFLAVAMTPLLTAKLAGHYVAVDAVSLFTSTLQVVLLPVLTGVALAHYFPSFVSKVSPFAPLVAILTVAILCASAIAQNSQAILSSGGQVVLAVLALHATGFLLGYVLSKLLGVKESVARTISIEVGMQNSVLGVVLANQHFSSPLTAVPCAISSVCHSVMGSSLAAFWRIVSKDTLSERVAHQ